MIHTISIHMREHDEYAVMELKVIGTWGEAWRIACSQAQSLMNLQVHVTHMGVDVKGFRL